MTKTTSDESTNFLTPRVYVVDYDPMWIHRFGVLYDTIWPMVCDIAKRIEHVGSTAIPNLAAKPIIDLDIIVASLADVELCIPKMTELGYSYLGELGIEGRHAFRHSAPAFAHNLYVCIDGSVGLCNHLTLRDHLRKYPEDASIYSALKKRLAAEHPHDIEAYVEGKTAFIISILARYAMTDAELQSIARANEAPR